MSNVSGIGLVRERVVKFLHIFQAVMFVLFIAGCAGKTVNTYSGSQMEAIRHNQRGIAAEARGDHTLALAEFTKALRINRSIENNEGVVVALVNSSRTLRQNGNPQMARDLMNRAVRLVTPESPIFPEIAFEMAQLLLVSGELDQALTWTSKTGAAGSEASRGRMLNLQARIRFIQGDLDAAEKTVREALFLNIEQGSREETANSHRTLGDILAVGTPRRETVDCYNRALIIDKELGRSRKIAADLRGLARLFRSLGDAEQALVSYRRACDVSSAAGDSDGAADDLEQMARIHESRGDKSQTERFLAERDLLLKNGKTP